MSIKGVKLKSESFFPISPGVLELWRKSLGGGGGGFRPPTGSDRVKVQMKCFFLLLNLEEQQKQKDHRLPFLNISAGSRAIKV